jgi:OOP family OmpA-OmpF porin
MKKTKLIVISTALAAAALAAPAYAQSKAGFEPGFYVGLGFGQSHVSGANTSGVLLGSTFTTAGFDDNKTTFQVNGGYQFTENWGIEIQYTDLGSHSGTVTVTPPGTTVATQSIKAYQVGIAGTGTLPLEGGFFLRGKLGISSNHLGDLNIVVAGTPVNIGGSNHTDVLAGAAIGYKWNENLSTRLEYEYFGKFQTSGGVTSSGTGSNVGLRMQYKF